MHNIKQQDQRVIYEVNPNGAPWIRLSVYQHDDFGAIVDRRSAAVASRRIAALSAYLVEGDKLSIIPGGGVIAELEAIFAKRYGRSHALALNSGTAAIHAALVGLNLPRGSEIVCSNIAFHASISPSIQCGLSPVLADVDSRTGNLTTQTLESVVTSKTSCIVVTHKHGRAANMAEIWELRDVRTYELSRTAQLHSILMVRGVWQDN